MEETCLTLERVMLCVLILCLDLWGKSHAVHPCFGCTVELLLWCWWWGELLAFVQSCWLWWQSWNSPKWCLQKVVLTNSDTTEGWKAFSTKYEEATACNSICAGEVALMPWQWNKLETHDTASITWIVTLQHAPKNQQTSSHFPHSYT